MAKEFIFPAPLTGSNHTHVKTIKFLVSMVNLAVGGIG